jgi:hypothetical protein
MTGEDDLRIYTVLALCERLQQPPFCSKSAVEHLVKALAAALREEPQKPLPPPWNRAMDGP